MITLSETYRLSILSRRVNLVITFRTYLIYEIFVLKKNKAINKCEKIILSRFHENNELLL